MRIVVILMLALLTALVLSNEVSAQSWDFVYEGDKIPDENEWEIFMTAGMKVSDVCEVAADGSLHITDPADKVCFFLPEVDGVETGTIEARVKVLSQAGVDYTILFGIEDTVSDAWIGLFPDHVAVGDAQTRHDVDMTDYHTVRLTKEGTEFILYVDDEEVLDGTLATTTDRAGTIIFGSGSTGGTGEHYWDYVVYTAGGAFSPEELLNYPSTLAIESRGKAATCWGMLKSR
ncbi:hypothetical protein ACFL6S_03345 [Candidatus Poribacteria bacterium]